MMAMRWLILLVLAAALVSGCGGGEARELASVRRGEIRDTFVEPARTRLEPRRIVTMPATARVATITARPGDAVAKGQRLLEVDLVPFDAAVSEARAAAAALADRLALMEDNSLESLAVDGARAQAAALAEQLRSAEGAVDAQRAREVRLRRELDRLVELVRTNAASATQLDDARLAHETAAIDLRRREFDRAQAAAQASAAEIEARRAARVLERRVLETSAMRAQLDEARARLALAEHRRMLLDTQLVSPIDGLVLERYEVGGGPIAEGSPVFLVGTLEALEVEAEALTQDAVALRPGSPVEYTVVPGQPPLRGVVSRVEPAGFVKLSSLGVEQQRVRVISTIESRPEALGFGFRVQGRYEKASKSNALVVPRSAVIQAPDESYFVFKAESGRARRTPVKLGLASDFEIEILDGLAEGDQIIRAPDTKLRDGEGL